MKNEQNINREDLLFRYCIHKVTPEEKETVENLIAASEELAQELETVKRLVHVQKKMEEIESYDILSGYTGVQKLLDKPVSKNSIITRLSRIAAILTIPLLISTITLAYIAFNNENEEEILYTEVVAAPGVVTRFELPDKSRVWLNSNSSLRYPNRFKGKTREVELQGEGYFEVESDEKHPFYVTTGKGLKVMAHGTRFNINIEKNIVEAILAEGKVSIVRPNHTVKELRPGEEALFDQTTGMVTIQESNLMEKLAWKEGKIMFRNAPLEKIFNQLSKHYNVDIYVHDDHNLSRQYLSRRVTFTSETIQQIFSYLELAAPIQWKITNPTLISDSTLTRQQIDVWFKK